MRVDWVPPYPLIKAEFDEKVESLGIALIGVQLLEEANKLEFVPAKLIEGENAPNLREYASFTDEAGYQNNYWIAYWTDGAAYESWLKHSPLHDWLAEKSRLTEGRGYFLETFTIPMPDLETIFGTPNKAGAACCAHAMVENDRTHGYWGSMRDRMPNSVTDPFVSSAGPKLIAPTSKETAGKRLRVIAPNNMCYIRSGQDYSHCGPEQRETYIDRMKPVLQEGMDFLRDNPEETGCCSMRFSNQVEGGKVNRERTFGLGLFQSLGNLEDWSATHPTHLQIFSRWQQMYRQYNFALELQTWHEVGIIREGSSRFEYVNCHPKTGLLPHYSAVEA